MAGRRGLAWPVVVVAAFFLLWELVVAMVAGIRGRMTKTLAWLSVGVTAGPFPLPLPFSAGLSIWSSSDSSSSLSRAANDTRLAVAVAGAAAGVEHAAAVLGPMAVFCFTAAGAGKGATAVATEGAAAEATAEATDEAATEAADEAAAEAVEGAVEGAGRRPARERAAAVFGPGPATAMFCIRGDFGRWERRDGGGGEGRARNSGCAASHCRSLTCCCCSK